MNRAGNFNGQSGVVLGPGPEGWWDSARMSSPQVLRGDDGTWKMWYCGRDTAFDPLVQMPGGRCGMAVSPDGINWERFSGPLPLGSVMEPAPATVDRFDNAHVGITDIHYRDGIYWMWYMGGDQTVQELNTPMGVMKTKGIGMRPGCAISRDGQHWISLGGPYRGAFLDLGGVDAWDRLFCAFPRVLMDDDGTYKMHYHSFNPENGEFTIGMALSEDGFRWRKLGPILGPGTPGGFDELGASCRYIIKIDGQYLMFYEGANRKGYYSIGLAVSDDGITWRRDEAGEQPGGPVFCHAPVGSGRWDSRAVGTPFIVPMPDHSYRMYYLGSNEITEDHKTGVYQIGLAVSDGANIRKWHRWDEVGD